MGYEKYPKMLNRDMSYLNKVAMLKVLSRSRDNFLSPRMMHFVVGFDINTFETDRLCQRFKEAFESEVRRLNKPRKPENKRRKDSNAINKIEAKEKGTVYKKQHLLRERSIPNIELIYSVEAKIPKKNNSMKPLRKNLLMKPEVYYHIHIMLICDVGHNAYSHTEIKMCTNNALARIEGLQSLSEVNNRYGFLKQRDKRTTVKAEGKFLSLYWHDLKLEYEDAVIRASYLCKLEQKSLLPERYANNSFGHTRVRRQPKM